MSNEIEASMPNDGEHWEIYVTYVDDKPAVILVDMAVAQIAPIKQQPTLVWLWVSISSADEEGFPSEEEDFKLNEIEDSVTESLDLASSRYVGRITSDGRREFYFYTDDSDEFRETVTNAMSSFSEYRFEVDESEDTEWSHYHDILYPSPEDFQQIHNQHVITRLHQAGDTLTQPRPVDHYANFRTNDDRDAFVAATQALGYEAASRPDRSDETDFPFAVGLIRVDPVDAETIDRITFELFELAQQHGGEYEGWGSKVVSS